MAENIKGINVKIGGDTSQLEKSIKSVNDSIRNTSKNLTAINNQLKFTEGTKSIELLVQKQGQLAKAIEDAKSKVDAYKKAQEEASKALANGEIGQAAYDELTRKLMAAETQVLKFENELQKTNETLLQEKYGADQAADAIDNEGNAVQEGVEKHNNFAGVVAGVATALGAIAVAAAKAAVDMGKAVVESYGEFEQLVGGVETLFGAGGLSMEEYAKKTGKTVSEISGEYQKLVSAEETVLANADEAYKTAGLSANEYMETVTSFSASLIQSLDGDTQAAAEKANQAIIDMSDNANKMGTDISSIQNAYQGFAKQNYTMLDNLKLGFGGTKEEMQRLLDTANEYNKEQGINTDYQIQNYADIVDAIHVVQTEMGITGTTAKEAEDTIQGSIAMTQSAWENFVISLGTGEGVDEALQNVADSFENVVKNITPVIERLVAAIPVVLEKAIPLIQGMLPKLLTAATQLFQQVLTGLVNAIPMLTSVIVQMVQAVVTTIVANAPNLITGAIELVTQLVKGIVEMIPMLIDAAIEIVNGLLDYIMENGPTLLEGGMEMLANIAQGIIDNLPELINATTEMINTFLNYILENLPQILQMGMNILMQIALGIIQNLPQIIMAVVQMIVTFTSTIVEHLPEILQKGIEIIAQLVVGIIQAIPQVVEGIGQVIQGIFNTIQEKWNDFVEAGKNIVNGIAEGIKNGAIAVWDAIKGVCQDAWDAVTDFFDIASPSKLMRDGVGKYIDYGWAEGITKYADKVNSAVESVSRGVMDAFNAPVNANYSVSANRTANIYLTSPVYLDGKLLTASVNQQLGVML